MKTLFVIFFTVLFIQTVYAQSADAIKESKNKYDTAVAKYALGFQGAIRVLDEPVTDEKLAELKFTVRYLSQQFFYRGHELIKSQVEYYALIEKNVDAEKNEKTQKAIYDALVDLSENYDSAKAVALKGELLIDKEEIHQLFIEDKVFSEEGADTVKQLEEALFKN